MANRDFNFSSTLTVAEIVHTFRDVVDSKAYFGFLQKVAVSGGARFEWSQPESEGFGMFDQFDEDRPAFSAVKSLTGTSGFVAWALHIYVYERENSREVLLSARGDKKLPVRAAEMFIQEVRRMDPQLSAH